MVFCGEATQCSTVMGSPPQALQASWIVSMASDSFIYPSLFLSVCLSLCLFLTLSISWFPSLSPSVDHDLCVYTCVSLSLSSCLSSVMNKLELMRIWHLFFSRYLFSEFWGRFLLRTFFFSPFVSKAWKINVIVVFPQSKFHLNIRLCSVSGENSLRHLPHNKQNGQLTHSLVQEEHF